MHPRLFLENHWRNDMRNEVFVCMDFRDSLKNRFRDIFQPAIEEKPINGLQLKAKRVDLNKNGECILYEIIDGIAHSQLVLADISVVDRWREGENWRIARNANVLFEVGLAIACRQKDEVIILRDDKEQMLFDIGSVRAIEFDPHSIQNGITLIRDILTDRLKHRQIMNDVRFANTLAQLSPTDIWQIRNVPYDKGSFYFRRLGSSANDTLTRLLRMQRLAFHSIGENRHPRYMWTAFGQAMAEWIWNNFPEKAPAIEV